MKIKLTTEIKQADGHTPIKNPGITDEKGRPTFGSPMTLKDVCIQALLAPDQSQKDDAKAKYSDYELFKKLRDVKEIDLKSEEIVRIKKKIGSIYPPLVLGQAYDLLEKNEK